MTHTPIHSGSHWSASRVTTWTNGGAVLVTVAVTVSVGVAVAVEVAVSVGTGSSWHPTHSAEETPPRTPAPPQP